MKELEKIESKIKSGLTLTKKDYDTLAAHRIMNAMYSESQR